MIQPIFPQAVNFSVSADFTTDSSPAGISIGDINGDGKPDIVTANAGTNTISVFLNTTPNGASIPSFSAKTDFTAGNGTISVAIGDLNGDGKPDIVAVNQWSSTVSVFLNTTPTNATTPTFSARTDFTTGSVPYYIAIADLNGDGKPDIVTANAGTNTISVFLNTTPNGASIPSFSAKTDFVTGSSCRWIAIGDLNGDGKLDVVTANYVDNNISVLLNTTVNGASTPSFSTNNLFTTGNNPASVAVGDLNGDGKLDIIAANSGSSTVSIFLNTTSTGASTPTFSTKTDFTTGTLPTPVSISDLNVDGKPDIVVGNYNDNTVSVLLNMTSTGASTPSFPTKVDFITGTGPRGVAVLDLNNDGKLDIVTDNVNANTISVLLNTTGSINSSERVELISDNNFLNGIGLQGNNVMEPSLIDTLYPFGKGQSGFFWVLAQWGSRFNLSGVRPEIIGDSVTYADSGKSISFFNGSTQVNMEMFGSAEYLLPRQVGEKWPALYLAQRFQKQLNINKIDSLIFRINARLMFSINEMGSSYNPSLHTAQFQIYLTVQNLNTSSPDYGDYLWFGLMFYDYRYPEIPAYMAQDVGPDSTGKFIYGLASSDLYTGIFQNEQWINITKDIYPSILKAFQAAQARGYLKGSSINDMCIASMNIGWEIPGTFDCGFQYKDLGLTASIKNITSIDVKQENKQTPTNFTLSQNYPNPFNPSTKIKYSIPNSGLVTLKVYNILGQEIATLVNQKQKSGNYEVNFNASQLASGVYMYRIQAGDFSISKKMLFIK